MLSSVSVVLVVLAVQWSACQAQRQWSSRSGSLSRLPSDYQTDLISPRWSSSQQNTPSADLGRYERPYSTYSSRRQGLRGTGALLNDLGSPSSFGGGQSSRFRDELLNRGRTLYLDGPSRRYSGLSDRRLGLSNSRYDTLASRRDLGGTQPRWQDLQDPGLGLSRNQGGQSSRYADRAGLSGASGRGYDPWYDPLPPPISRDNPGKGNLRNSMSSSLGPGLPSSSVNQRNTQQPNYQFTQSSVSNQQQMIVPKSVATNVVANAAPAQPQIQYVQQYVQQPQSLGQQFLQTAQPAPRMISTLVRPATNMVPVMQQATTNLVPVIQQTPMLLQQTPQMVPLVSVAAAPSLVQVPQNRVGFSGIGGLGSGMGRGGSMLGNMGHVIVKIEDMFPSFPQGKNQENGAGMRGGMGGSERSHFGESSHPIDPNLSVVKLDEGLSVVVNHSHPFRKIVNLPTPTNEDEAKALKKILENAEAPEYLRELVNFSPSLMPPAMPPALAPAMAPAMAPAGNLMAPAANVVAPSPNVVVPPASVNPAAGIAMGAAAAAAAAIVPSAAAPPAQPIVPQSSPVASTASSPMDSWTIDDILVNAYTLGGTTSNYPLASAQPPGKFIRTALDMELTAQQFAELHFTPSSTRRFKRKAIINTRSRWPGGVVPYEIQGAFRPDDNRRLLAAMAQWSQNTCIQFRPALPTDMNKLIFQDGKGCSSNVGMIGGRQFLTLQKECRVPKILLHEIGHALGMIHEHQREDRDNFLKINYSNIKSGGLKDFSLFKKGSVDHSITGYDYMSIMHYGKSAFALKSGMITMEAVDPKYTNLMGTTGMLSHTDINTINSIYGCSVGVGGMGFSQASPVFTGMQGQAAAPVAPAAAVPAQPLTVPAEVMVSTGNNVQAAQVING